MATFVIVMDSNSFIFWVAFYDLIIITAYYSNADIFNVIVFWAFKATEKSIIEMESLGEIGVFLQCYMWSLTKHLFKFMVWTI